MRRLPVLLALIPGFVLSAVAQSDDWAELVDTHELAGLSVVTRCQGDIQVDAHVGLRDIGRDLPVTGETTFRMASISKAVVALAVAKLVETGTLAYDAPLSDYMDSPPSHPGHPDIPLTVDHLLSHTSGIRDGSGYGDFLSESYANLPNVPALSDVLAPGGAHYTDNMWGSAAPGTWFQYANLNFGVLATVMEAATGQRFDLLMEELLFAPYGLDAGYRVQQLDEINDLAVLYRQVGGAWSAQADQYEGVMPEGPDWSEYLPGVSAVCFSPQGGLRIGTRDLTVLAQLWSQGEATTPSGMTLPFLGAPALDALHAEQWAYNAGQANGNNYYGLFNRWARGLHLAASGLGADEVIPDVAVTPFIGHPGEAYGLISDAYTTPAGEWGFAFVTNGKWSGYGTGSNSAFYQVEEDVFALLREDLLACLTASTAPPVTRPQAAVLAPRTGDTTLQVSGLPPGPWTCSIWLLDGRAVCEGTDESCTGTTTRWSVSPLEFGWHVLRLTRPDGTVQPIPFFVAH